MRLNSRRVRILRLSSCRVGILRLSIHLIVTGLGNWSKLVGVDRLRSLIRHGCLSARSSHRGLGSVGVVVVRRGILVIVSRVIVVSHVLLNWRLVVRVLIWHLVVSCQLSALCTAIDILGLIAGKVCVVRAGCRVDRVRGSNRVSSLAWTSLDGHWFRCNRIHYWF